MKLWDKLKRDDNTEFNLKLKEKAMKDKSYLGIKSSTRDILRLPKWYQISLYLIFILILFLNFYDINGYNGKHFAPLVEYNMVKDLKMNSLFGVGNTGAIIVSVLYSLNGLAAITGLISLSFMSFGYTSQFFWGCINGVIFGFFSLSISAFGDFVYQMLRVFGSFFGWYMFVYKDLVNRKQVQEKTKKQKFNFWMMVIAACSFSIFMWYFAMSGIGFVAEKNSSTYISPTEYQRVLDGVVNGIAFVAYFMQVLNMGEQFWLWNIQIFPRIFKYIGIPGTGAITVPNLLIQFVVYLLMNCIGLYEKLFKEKINQMLEQKRLTSIIK